MNCWQDSDDEQAEFVEVDPSGRYGRYDQVLGKGAFKTVYRAFDEFDGIEVAWNQVKLHDVLRSPEDLERLYSEVHLLKSLKHKNIIKFYNSWVDTKNNNVNFITEIFTSGNLRQYRKKHRRVNMRAVKHWARQILRGLLYLHSHDPPIIHRDLKCDNIFVNGNQGEVKIGDLGLAGILRQAHAAHSVIGTPEFMAPELYEEDYNELVDIYSFGMCLLEMVTFEYPYSECMNAAQIYKKVTSGKKPAALEKVQDPQMRAFVEQCLAKASRRLPARELLMDPFLKEKPNPELVPHEYMMDDLDYIMEENGCSVTTIPTSLAPVVSSPTYESLNRQVQPRRSRDFRVKVRRRNDDKIFLKLRIVDQEGNVRNIHFPFDVEADTALCVASEMVTELDLPDQDVTTIADMIDNEIMLLVPHWKPGAAFEEREQVDAEDTVSSRNSEMESVSPQDQGTMHGRFEEFTYQSLPHVRSHYGGGAGIEDPLDLEMKLLAHRQEQELKKLQKQHEQAMVELKEQYYNTRREHGFSLLWNNTNLCNNRPSLRDLALCTSEVDEDSTEEEQYIKQEEPEEDGVSPWLNLSCGQDVQRKKQLHQNSMPEMEVRGALQGLASPSSFSAC